jgi:NTE family protein
MNSKVFPAQPVTRAVVLSGGGRAGAAWMLGLAAGLRDAGVDLAAADLIVGTSGGARTGTQLATGTVDQAIAAYRAHTLPFARTYASLPDFLAAARPIRAAASSQLDEARQIANLGPLGPGLASAAERRREVAASLLVRTWPSTPLKISAVDAESGHRVVFDARSGVSLTDAVTASGALPGIYPLAEINGRRFADGGAYSLYSADLAAGHDVVIVITPFPLAPHLRARLDTELAALGDCASHLILADQASLSAIGADPTAVTAQVPALESGMKQAAREVSPLRDAWNAHVAQRRARTAGSR